MNGTSVGRPSGFRYPRAASPLSLAAIDERLAVPAEESGMCSVSHECIRRWGAPQEGLRTA